MRLHGVRQSSLPVSRGQAPPVNRPASSIAVNAVSRGPPDKTVDCNTKNVALAQPVGTPVEATVEAMQGRAGEDGGTGAIGLRGLRQTVAQRVERGAIELRLVHGFEPPGSMRPGNPPRAAKTPPAAYAACSGLSPRFCTPLYARERPRSAARRLLCIRCNVMLLALCATQCTNHHICAQHEQPSKKPAAERPGMQPVPNALPEQHTSQGRRERQE